MVVGAAVTVRAPFTVFTGMSFIAWTVLGLLFSSYSTFDYSQHLDRRLHDIHCSIIPGAPVTDSADACRAAMYSPYSALFKEKYWGGIPISLSVLYLDERPQEGPSPCVSIWFNGARTSTAWSPRS